MKRIVFRLRAPSRTFASFTTFLTSATPEVTAENWTKWERERRAIMRANVVFPEPGGPQKIRETSLSSSSIFRKIFPFPTICSCPTNSSNVWGRIRSARGARLSLLLASSWWNKSSSIVLLYLPWNFDILILWTFSRYSFGYYYTRNFPPEKYVVSL